LLAQAIVQNGIFQPQCLRGLARPQQRTAIDARTTKGQTQRCHLGQSRFAQRDIGMTLDTARFIPRGRTMAEKGDFQTSISTTTGT
jgi:hypothetical protein